MTDRTARQTAPTRRRKLILAAAQRQDDAALLGLINGLLRPRQSEPAPGLLSEPDAARRLGISPRSLFTLAKDGHIAYVRIGTSKRYDPRELDRYITANTVKHTLPSPPAGT